MSDRNVDVEVAAEADLRVETVDSDWSGESGSLVEELQAVVEEHEAAIMAAMELISWGYGAYDAYVLGFEWMFAAVMAGLAAVGLAAHSMEPGLFTKDKNASSSKKE